MALVSAGYRLRVEFTDNSGYHTTRTYDLVAADETEALAARTTILAAIANVTDALITKTEVVLEHNEAVVVLPAAGVQVENQALLILQLTDITKSATVSIPAPKIAIFQDTSGPGADIVDPTDAAVIAYWGLFDGTPATVSDGESASGLRRGHRRHVASREH